MVQTAIIKQDLLYPSVSPVVYAVQGDNLTRAIQILLFSGGQPVTISEDCSAIIGYTNPDGTSGAYDSFSDESGTTPAYDMSENGFRFFLAPEMLSEPGDVFITVKITNEGKSLHSFELILRVQKNHGLEPHSENYFKIAGTVADSGWSPNEYLGTDENGKVVAKKLDGTFVKTVNGVAPDENGNVNVEGGGGGIAEETDPTVPAWAKQPNKPSYTAAEVGALPSSTVIPTVPSALKNPHALTFTGAVEATYDGSGPVSVVIPQPGSGGSGEPGADGFSPIATVTQTGSGAVISITDKSGTTTATVFNGKDGKDGYTPVKGVDYFDGAPGKDGNPGADGYTPVKGKDYFDGKDGQDGSPGKDGSNGVSATHSWNGTTLTITSASGTSSANLKGDKGDTGAGGSPGADGVSPTVAVSKSGKVTTVSITDKNGTKTATINDGADGSPGSAGKDGTNGVSVSSVTQTTTSSADGGSNVVTVTLSNGTTSTFTVKNGSKGSTGATGATGAAGKNGADGYTPVRGTDYWTEADKVEIVQRVIETLGGNPIFGIVDENNNIVVSGDLPDGTYSVKYEMENGTKLNIGNLVIDTNVYYTVTNTLTQCTTNNSATKAVQGGSYSATITAKSGYELKSIVVRMGGTDISASAVSGGKITISNVTGNIVITAVAEEIKAAYTNLADPTSSDWADGKRFNSSGALVAVDAGVNGATTNYIGGDLVAGDVIRIKGMDLTTYRTAIYDKNKTQKSLGGLSSAGYYFDNIVVNSTGASFTIKTTVDNALTGGGYIRFCGPLNSTSADVIITKNEEIA